MITFDDILNKLKGNANEEKKDPAAPQQGKDFNSILNSLGAGRRNRSKQLVDTYVADIAAFSENVSAAGGSMDYNNYQDTIQGYTQQRDAFLQRTDELIGYLNKNADLYEKESLDEMLQWLGQNKTYLQTLGMVFDQQKNFYDSFTSEKDYTLYDTYKDTSAEELRNLAKTQEDWETRDWMENRAAALEYKAARPVAEIDAEIAEVQQRLKAQQEADKEADGFLGMVMRQNGLKGDSAEVKALQEQLNALRTERQTAAAKEREDFQRNALKAAAHGVSGQTDYAERPLNTIEEIDAYFADLDRQIEELENDPVFSIELYRTENVPLVRYLAATTKLENLKEQRNSTQLLQKRASLLPEYLVNEKYAHVFSAPDFQEKSQYTGMENILADADYGYINGDEGAEDLLGFTLNSSGQKAAGVDITWVTRLRENEKKIYNYLYNTEGRSKASEFLSELKPALLQRQREDEERFARWDAQRYPLETSVSTIIKSPLKGLSFVGQTVDMIDDGQIDPNAAYNRHIYISNAIREEVPKNWGPVGSFAYQTGMGLLDFVTTTAVAGGNPTIAMAIMGSGAAADKTLEALDRGLSSEQAYTLGVIAGVAEAITEKMPLDALLDKALLSKDACAYILRLGLAEGGEEVASSVINGMADVMISKDKSEWNQLIQKYKDMGYEENEAFARAMADQAASLGLDFLGGLLSGGALGGLNVGANLVFKGNQKATTEVQQVELGVVQTPDGVTNAPQVAVQNPTTMEQNPGFAEQNPGFAEQNPGFAEQNPTKAEQTVAKTEQQVQQAAVRQETAEVVNSRDAMQRKLQAAEEAYRNGVITKKQLKAVQKEASAWNITNTIDETERIDIRQARDAFESGQIDEETYYQIEDAYREQQEQLGTTSNVDETLYGNKNNTMGTEEVTNGTGENLHLRNGAQWSYGQSADGQVSGVEEAPGRVQEWNPATRSAGDGSYSQATQGRVNAQGLGIPGGTGEANLQRVDVNYSGDTRQAAQIAEENGLEAVFFIGDNLSVEYEGKVENAKACIVGNKAYIRADHPGFTATQLMKHELTHHKIDAGLIDTDHVYDMLVEFYGEERLREIIAEYAAAYDMGDTSVEAAARAVFMEIVCDSEAGINYFGMKANTDAEGFMRNVRSAATVDMYSRDTRGPPAEGDIHFSRDSRYEDQVDKVKNNTHDQQNHVYMGTTPAGIASILDLPKLPMLITSQHVYSMAVSKQQAKAEKRFTTHTNYHSLGWDAVKKLPKYINKPAMIIKSTTDPNDARFVIVTAQVDADGNPIVAAIKPNGTGNYFNLEIPANFMLSSYGKNNFQQFISRAKTEDRILYVEKSSQKNKNTTNIQYAGNILSSDYTKNLARFRQIVKKQFEGTVLANSGLPKFSREIQKLDGVQLEDVQDTQEGLEELREREEAEYADVKEKLASGELKPREELTTKAKNYLQKAERTLLNRIRYALSVPRVAARENLKGTVEQLSAEFLATGRFTQETVDRLFEDAWNQGVIEDREFYDNYKHIKDFLRTSAVTIRETDSHDIADYRDFKRRARYTLRIVEDGGQSVDSLYTELMDMAPELFPADITHPADQLEKMYDVGKSIYITEQNLNSIGGEFGRQMKQDARNAFEDAMQAVREDLRNVKRAADDRAEQKRNAQEKPTYDTVDKVVKAYEDMKKARRVADKAVAQNLLTARDEMLVGRLLRGEILVEDLNPETDNVKGITEVYEAKKAYEALAKPLVEYKKKMKAHLLHTADTFLETANSWKDKKAPLAYSRETMRRNILDIVPDKAVAKQILEHYFEPVAKQEAQRTRFKTEMRKRVAELNLGTKVAKGNIVSESHAVQLLGEAMDNIQCLENAKGYMKTRDGKTLDEWHAVIWELWEQNPNLDRAKVQSAVDAFREIYDELFKQMNEVRVRFGYEPVNYRRGYFPHFQQQADGIMAQFGRALGIDTTVATLPTSITGITHTFKPGIRWFGNTMERLGFDTTYDAIGGFDMYIEGVSDVIFQTENIQNLRALASQIRYRTTDDGIREQIDKIKVDERLTEAEKDTKIREVYENGKFVLNNFIKELDEYTNLLANKKSKWDRTAEDALGRTAIYRVYKRLNNMVAANMVVGNLTSPITNLIPINQTVGRTGAWNMLRGMWDSFRNNVNLEKDGLDDISDFLTNRRGSELLSKTTMQKVQKFGGAFMEAVDMFTSGAVVRAEYYHNLQKGMTEAEAMHQADLFAADVIADRSKGAMPTIFASQVLKPVTAFQLEVNNEMSVIFKDLGRYYGDDEKGKLILAILAYFVGAYIFNDVFELVAGRRAAMDPLYILNELAGDTTGYQIPSLYELLSGTASFKTEKEKNVGTVVQNLASDVVSELPFSGLAGLLNSFGILDLEDAGRVPVSAALPDVIKIISALSDDEAAGEYKWHVVANELSNLMYVIPPFGGSQLLKTGKGIHALIRGGSYTVNKKGEEQLQYPIYTDTVGQAIWNGFRAVVMGKNSTGGALEWVGRKFDTFSAKHTEVYQQMVASGVKQRDAFDLINELRHIRKTDEETKKSILRRTLQNADISNDGKLLAYNGIIASKSEQDLIVALTGVDENSGAILKVLYGMQETVGLKGEEATKAKLQVLDSSGMNAEGQLTAYYDLIAGESEKEIIVELDALGADSGSVYDAVRNIREAKLLKGDAETSAKWQAVADADLTDAQKNVLAGYIMGSTEMKTETGNPTKWAKLQEGRKRGLTWDQYSKMVSYEITLDSYLKYTSEGLSSDKAIELLIETEGVEPMEGKEQLADVQKYLVIAERPWNETMKDMALEGIMSEGAYEKYRAAADAGIRTYIYITFLYDINGWTSDKDASGKTTKSKQDKIDEYINGLDLTEHQKDVLFLTKYPKADLSKTSWHN